MDPDIPYHKQALQLVQEHVTLLGNRDYNQIMRRMKLSETELQKVLKLVQSLNPRPGSQITSATPQYVVPDVFVFKNKSKWQVDLNIEAAPRLRINSQYASMVKRADNSEDNTYLRNHLQEARWFLKSLQSRHETLLKVARCIVDRQRNFFEYGDEAMKPLVLRDIAEAVDMHESTISRVTTQKYMHTPRGIYEFKYFFSSHVGTEDGGECSATAIRAIVKKLISAETPTKPLSDSKIAALLSEQGINVARRTIAKYRESMAIPPSNERKRLA
jgi:RNA polymerase sigma-54 factor